MGWTHLLEGTWIYVDLVIPCLGKAEETTKMIWLLLSVHFFLEVTIFAASLSEQVLWNLLIGCWQSQLSKFLKITWLKQCEVSGVPPHDPFPLAVLRHWWCLPAAWEPSASTSAASWRVPVNHVLAQRCGACWPAVLVACGARMTFVH